MEHKPLGTITANATTRGSMFMTRNSSTRNSAVNYDPFQLPRATSALSRASKLTNTKGGSPTSTKKSQDKVPFTNTQVSRPSRTIMREAYPMLLNSISRDSIGSISTGKKDRYAQAKKVIEINKQRDKMI